MKAGALLFAALMVTLPAASFAQDGAPSSNQTEPHQQGLDQLNRELQKGGTYSS
ncbi:MAG: hypothetical protein IT344_06550 [Candidatus Dadabacteria bacterium]|nr:hypothetical protein [Candidatus Dadabacteria bacterium]